MDVSATLLDALPRGVLVAVEDWMGEDARGSGVEVLGVRRVRFLGGILLAGRYAFVWADVATVC